MSLYTLSDYVCTKLVLLLGNTFNFTDFDVKLQIFYLWLHLTEWASKTLNDAYVLKVSPF